MKKTGYISIILGILTIIGFSLYLGLSDLEVPIFVKAGISLIVFGVVIILIKQIYNRKEERKEEENYKNY